MPANNIKILELQITNDTIIIKYSNEQNSLLKTNREKYKTYFEKDYLPLSVDIDITKLINYVDKYKLHLYNNTVDESFSTTINDFIKAICSDQNTEFSILTAVDIALLWITVTDGYSWNVNNTTFYGGYPTCAIAVAVALSEGGDQVAPTEIYDAPYASNYPLDRGDPVFSSSTAGANGGFWQTSSAADDNKYLYTNICISKDPNTNWVSSPHWNSENLMCQAWMAMLWSADGQIKYNDIEYNYSDNIRTTDACNGSIELTESNIKSGGINPNIYLGPFCFGKGAGAWNSPLCRTAFITGKPIEKNSITLDGDDLSFFKNLRLIPYCLIAIEAAQDALNKLEEKNYTRINKQDPSSTSGYDIFKSTCNNISSTDNIGNNSCTYSSGAEWTESKKTTWCSVSQDKDKCPREMG